MKELEIIDEYTMGEYTGRAVKLAGGTEGFESIKAMNQSEVTWVAPGQTTLGHIGGWVQGGGHSSLSGTYGLGADQILSLNVVTADGRFVTADVNQNTDLFFALRGGGGGKSP
jgi:FAD/FMN-containing dehydrogenase